ncbi:site-specific integrase [Arthrobacter rhizosphaerae]|uniref:site-specific integrase n=1 Tax=Arthrobacter rhizosphaerae TaxID=2855490 RepID=UPI001FF46089|nr:tyrosine-type recombinase/integrase [Arthrobacter rhizosphaerae]
MPRPPLPVGSWGKIKRTEIDKGRWVAKARVRDLDGVTRLVERNGRSGAEAEPNLNAHLAERTAPSAEDLTPESRLTALWEAYEAHLLEEGRAIRTMERYRYVSTYVLKGLGGYRIREITTQRLDGFVKALKTNHGPSVATSSRVILSSMFGPAVRFGAANTNPVRDVGTIKMESKAARALSADELRGILDAMRSSQLVLNPANRVTPRQTLSQYCAAADLTDVVIMYAATGARISEVLVIRWRDIDFTAKTVTISGKVNRAPGLGMIRESFAKTAAGQRVLPLPAFAIAMLMGRRVAALGNMHDVVFPSALGTLRDPPRCTSSSAPSGLASSSTGSHHIPSGRHWPLSWTIRASLHASALTNSATPKISMTQDVYMGRKAVHTEVADVLDRVVRIAGT